MEIGDVIYIHKTNKFFKVTKEFNTYHQEIVEILEVMGVSTNKQPIFTSSRFAKLILDHLEEECIN